MAAPEGAAALAGSVAIVLPFRLVVLFSPGMRRRVLASYRGPRRRSTRGSCQAGRNQRRAIRSFRFRPGEIEGEQGNYLLLDVVDLDTGEGLVLNTSATNESRLGTAHALRPV